MANKTLLLEHPIINGNFDIIYEHIFDLRKFGEIHPYMKEVTELSKTPTDTIKYEIKEETYLLGFFKIKPTYEAEVIELEAKKHIRYYSIIKKSIMLNINFFFPENHTSSHFNITERIELRGNPLLIAYFASILEKAHLQTFENLSKKLKTSE